MLQSSEDLDASLLAGTIRYVSSAYLQRKLPASNNLLFGVFFYLLTVTTPWVVYYLLLLHQIINYLEGRLQIRKLWLGLGLKNLL